MMISGGSMVIVGQSDMIIIHWLYSGVGNNVVMIKSVVKLGFCFIG
jgi:hypothetical protein